MGCSLGGSEEVAVSQDGASKAEKSLAFQQMGVYRTTRNREGKRSAYD
jgi:hypothetical protein